MQSKPKKSNRNHAGYIGKPKQTSEKSRISCAGNAKTHKKAMTAKKINESYIKKQQEASTKLHKSIEEA